MVTARIVRPRVDWFRHLMLYKLELPKNQSKGEWRGMKAMELLNRLKQEVTELEAAIKAQRPDEAVMEAADVANFAMMIADVAVNAQAAADLAAGRRVVPVEP